MNHRSTLIRIAARLQDHRGLTAADEKPSFKTIPNGTKVTWHYRSAIGHGTVTGVHKMGTHPGNTMYSIRQSDHHEGEPATVYHSGDALTRVS